MTDMNGFTVACLLFGDHHELAKRCLWSIQDAWDPELCRSLRVGLNAVCPRTREVVREILDRLPPETEVLVYDSPVNRFKYPMMRKMLHDPVNPVMSQFVMWFDDDSCIVEGARRTGWWDKVHIQMQASDMIGALYKYPVQSRQAVMIMRQSWYANRPVGPMFMFATGGWWTCRTRILQKWDYPFRELTHNGGDTVLGELMRQQKYRLDNFREGVWINADNEGRESKAARRGRSTPRLWAPNWKPDDDAHRFDITPYDPRQKNGYSCSLV